MRSLIYLVWARGAYAPPLAGLLVGVEEVKTRRQRDPTVLGVTAASRVCTVSDAPGDEFQLREMGSASGGAH